MHHRLPRNRTGLRALAVGLLPAYLVLWTAGTGCYDELYLYEESVMGCFSTLDLALEKSLSASQWNRLLTVESGVEVQVPPGTVSVENGSGTPGNVSGMARIDHLNRQGQTLGSTTLNFLGGTSIEGTAALLLGFPLQPGHRLALWVNLQQALARLYANFRFSPNASAMPSFRFPESTSRGPFTTAFDAEFHVGIDLPAGTLVFNGQAMIPEGSRAAWPKKIIVEVRHQNAAGQLLGKHKQVIKIDAIAGTFLSKKAFKGFEVEAGEHVLLRLKPKGGSLTGLNWSLASFINT